MFKNAEVIRIYTKDRTQIRNYHDTQLIFYKDMLRVDNKDTAAFQHLYVVTDERPKVGDWYLVKVNYGTGGKYVPESVGQLKEGEDELVDLFNPKKIIGSTDLAKEGVMGLSEEFRKEYCDRGGIDNVMVKFGFKIDKSMGELHRRRIYSPTLSKDGNLIIQLDMTQKSIYHEYREAMIKRGVPPVGKKRFWETISVLKENHLLKELNKEIVEY